MTHCKTCRHSQFVESYDALTCRSPKFLRGYHWKQVRDLGDEVRIEDDEGWGIFMGPKFGCVHHEPVEPTKEKLTEEGL